MSESQARLEVQIADLERQAQEADDWARHADGNTWTFHVNSAYAQAEELWARVAALRSKLAELRREGA